MIAFEGIEYRVKAIGQWKFVIEERHVVRYNTKFQTYIWGYEGPWVRAEGDIKFICFDTKLKAEEAIDNLVLKIKAEREKNKTREQIDSEFIQANPAYVYKRLPH